MIPLIDVLNITIAILSIGATIQAIEDLIQRAIFSTDGLLSWQIDRTAYRENSIMQRTLDIMFSGRIFFSLLVLKLTIPILCLTTIIFFHYIHVSLIASFFCLTVLFGLRSRHGLDGSHHMTLVILLSCMIAKFFEMNDAVVSVCLFYIAAQLVLSYFFSGIAKIIGEQWRNGSAFSGIFSTDAYGSPLLYRISQALPAIGIIVCWFVIFFEIFFPLIYFVPDYAKIGIAFSGILFHFIIAISMGLNKFLWAWWAAYPSLLWTLWLP